MTNNDTTTAPTFAAAAKEVADREFPDDKAGKSGNPERIAFQAGAEWARDYLAAHVPQVTIVKEDGQPATCEVRQGGVLIFAGRDRSADLRVAAQEPTDAEVEAADRGRVEHNIRRRMTDAEWAATRSRVEHEAMRAALSAARKA